ncbi:hypothetical protein HY477_00955 [Candidatus Uhrbacteria bacterium]|nr:hypothetical protein [Candidatus Uhrbacteria bacterium]
MNQEIQPQQVSPNSKLSLTIVVSVLLTALIVGAGVYFWQSSNLERTKQDSQTQISSLQEQIAILQRDNQSLQISSTASKIKFPLIVYGRPGLLNNTEAGKIEKNKLEENLVNPFVDYFNEKEVKLVTLYITVPQNIGGEYLVDAFFAGGGYQGFLFGKREQEYGYWSGPECMGPCEFSETFKKKYPQIVQ